MFNISKATIEAVLEKDLGQGNPQDLYHDTKASLRLENKDLWEAVCEMEAGMRMVFITRVFGVATGLDPDVIYGMMDPTGESGEISVEDMPEDISDRLNSKTMAAIWETAHSMSNGAMVNSLLIYKLLKAQYEANELDAEMLEEPNSPEEK